MRKQYEPRISSRTAFILFLLWIIVPLIIFSSLSLSKGIQAWISVAGMGSAFFWYLSATVRPAEFQPAFNSAAAILTGVTIMLGVALTAVSPGEAHLPDTIKSPSWLIVGLAGALILLCAGSDQITDGIAKAPYPKDFKSEPSPIITRYFVILLSVFLIVGVVGLTIKQGWQRVIPFLNSIFEL